MTDGIYANRGPETLTLADLAAAQERLRGAQDEIRLLDERLLRHVLRDALRTGKSPAEIGRLALEALRPDASPGEMRAAELQMERVLARIPGAGGTR